MEIPLQVLAYTDLAGSRGAGTVLPVAGQHVSCLVDQDLAYILYRLVQYGAVSCTGVRKKLKDKSRGGEGPNWQ